MKTMPLIVAAILMSFAAPLAAVEIDITEDPNSEFFIGYRMKYPPSDCEVIWFASQWQRNYLMGVGNCERVSNDRAYRDIMNAMKSVKAKSNAANFSEYQREIKSKIKPETPKTRLRCVDTHSGTYVFLRAEARNKPGWFYLDKLRNGGRLNAGIVGYWKEVKGGNLIADFGISTVNVNMDNVYDC